MKTEVIPARDLHKGQVLLSFVDPYVNPEPSECGKSVAYVTTEDWPGGRKEDLKVVFDDMSWKRLPPMAPCKVFI